MITRNLIVVLISSIALMACQLNAAAQDVNSKNTMKLGENGKSPAAKIVDIAWIAGNWQGEAMGGKFEETWNPPMAGAMMGMFKHTKGEDINFYEFLTIIEHNDSLLMRLKHFDNKLHGWEEKNDSVEFPLVKVTDTEVFFDGLTFRKVDNDTMHIFVVVGSKEDKSRELKFACRRSGQN